MKNKHTIKIGTRGSKLALWQAEHVRQELLSAFPRLSVTTTIIKTKGDRITEISLSKIGDKGLFTKEIENALADGEIDIAVHSLKDLPTELPDNLIIGGILPRGEVRDVLLSREGKSLSELTPNDKIGTSSLRRKAQLLHYNPDLRIVDIRGNVDTRIRKMQEGYCDALIMAGAGIIRLGYDSLITDFMDPYTILPAVAQGAVAVEIREDDHATGQLLDRITDEDTWLIAMAERAFLRTIEGGCQIPTGCYSEQQGNRLKFSGMLAGVTGKPFIFKSVVCPIEEASEKAIELAREILEDGGLEILETIRNTTG